MAVPADAKFDLEARLLDYSAMIVRLVGKLPKDQAGQHIGSPSYSEVELRRCPIMARLKQRSRRAISFTR